MAKRVLLTGFEPFDGEPINAAWEVVSAFESAGSLQDQVFVRQLPTVFGASLRVLEQAIEEVNPDVVICVGQAGGRSSISVERIGVNLNDANIADNAGVFMKEQLIVADGPAAYWSTLPVSRLVEVLIDHGIPASASLSAGTYVCNHVLYGLMHLLEREPYKSKRVLGGFVHIPFLPSQAVRHRNAPSLGVEEVRRGLELIVQAVCEVS